MRREGHEVECVGPRGGEEADYPEVGAAAARRVAAGEFERGVLACGSGLGMAIVANKVPGIRAAACTNEYMAEMARRHNDANVLCVGGRGVG
ncbi:MAG: RpiB/LacA/LacB family sugar-phosphate isomerase, partial [Planctomycetota bacterium]|nr:RpiB/LacA/LacB family sugar-phosphate isomerase [Planctomycetota bacterium]